MEKKYREVRYQMGDFLDTEIYPVFKKSRSRSGKFGCTPEGMKIVNERNSRRRLSRLLHANFSEHDLAVHLTYRESELPKDEEQAKKDIRNFLRRARRLYKQAGIEFKYVSVTEKGKKSERVHHHLVVSGGVSRDELEMLWKKGRANTKRLQMDDNGIVGLSVYMTKQQLFFRRYNASRNLVDPDKAKRQNDSRVSKRAAQAICEFYDADVLARLYPGYRLMDVEYCLSDVTGEYYAYVRLQRFRT